MERSGQGLNLMIENAIRQTKPLPDFSGSAAHEVRLTMAGTVQHPGFIRFLERLGDERLSRFSTHDYMALDAILNDRPLTPLLTARLPGLIECGAIESQGRGKGRRCFLSRELYATLGTPGAYTRRKGLDHETNKALLIQHLAEAAENGASLSELQQVLPQLSARSVQRLLSELHMSERVVLQGARRWARWFPFKRQNPPDVV